MPALFPPSANAAYALGLLTVGAGASAALIAPMVYVRTPYGNYRDIQIEQPIQFDHRHHVRDDGIPCLYCHAGAESSARAGIPDTATCMGCHNQIWTQSELLAPVRASFELGVPIAWKRVYDVPDFVYFHHGVHVRGGIACARCHGAVENMSRVARAVPLTMKWCLDCHFHPPGGRVPQGRYVTALTTCSACHR